MIFKGTNNQIVDFQLKYHDEEALTGIKGEPIHRSLRLHIKEFIIEVCILISEVEEIINWFERLLLNKPVQPNLFTLDNQFYFTLIKNNLKSKIICITQNSTIPVPSMGAYSLSPGAKLEDFHKKTFVECKMDETELQRIVKELKVELDKSGNK
jgi:hypothetical protein